MDYSEHFDCIVVGGGHAGCEAASAAARMGAKTLLVTHNIETIGLMSCNPAIGGIGKGHLVKEIDAMGGLMASVTDKAGIQFRILNASKGPAVQATRAQACRFLYRKVMRQLLEATPNLSFFQQPVQDLIVDNNQVKGVVTQMGVRLYAKSVVLTVGTFLSGTIHIGEKNYSGGRSGDPASKSLARCLKDKKLMVGRLKTGTPARIDGNSIDFSQMAVQPGDTPVPVFSYLGTPSEHPEQKDCFITYTNEQTHAIIREGLCRSPMYSGRIDGVGPRYCPSIEDKVVRFADRDAHQVFIEPEGLYSNEFYPNGISTSLPFDVQLKFIRSIKGLEQAHITRPGYAIEYDYFDPRGLLPSLETKAIQNLFFAGQINGTTGYEEAGAQGLVAGINAARGAMGLSAWYPKRNEAYIGVLIDDLITHGTSEPYRMFTSRAEHRLLLREDNADLRLTPVAMDMGLVSAERKEVFALKRAHIEALKAKLNSRWVLPGSELDGALGLNLSKEARMSDLLKRPEITFAKLKQVLPEDFSTLEGGHTRPELTGRLLAQIEEQVETQIKYAGYIDRQTQEIAKSAKLEHKVIPEAFDYSVISGLSNEVVEKLQAHRPQTIGHASRIPGITPAAVSLLLIYLKKHNALETA